MKFVSPKVCLVVSLGSEPSLFRCCLTLFFNVHYG